jgi:hypothetical protein
MNPPPERPHWKYEELPEKFRKRWEKHEYGGAYQYYQANNGFWYETPGVGPPPSFLKCIYMWITGEHVT